MNEDFEHLFASSRPIAALSSDERLRRIRSDRWINYPRAQQALAMLEDLIEFPQRARMPNLLIVGASGMATSENREHAAANGVRHFLDKPFSVETLIRTAHVAMVKTAT